MKQSKKTIPSTCDNKMTFQECELAILRQAVDENEKIKGTRVVSNEDIKKILAIVEDFIIKKKLVCYGGTAINNILPSFAQFYDKEVEIPDYDFFSSNALEDAKELADIYYKEGYDDVEAKAGVHMGTFKVYVNYIPIADITQLVEPLFKTIQKQAIMRAGIRYAPPNYLRMAMYLELSRPEGDVSRWAKVLKRLTLLNKYYPLKSKKCATVDFQRTMEEKDKEMDIYHILLNNFIDQGVVFFGSYATSMYSRHMPKNTQHKLKRVPDFDVLSVDIDRTALILKEELERNDYTDIKMITHEPIGELVPKRIQFIIKDETLAFIYEPVACHSYNKLMLKNKEVKIATIDTILSFYLVFLYTNLGEYDEDRLLCMSQYLYDVQEKNRLKQVGVLKRFNMDCVGKQPTLEDMRAEKAEKFKQLRKLKDTKEYEMWFLRYVPIQMDTQRGSVAMSIAVPRKTRKAKSTGKKTQKKKSVFSKIKGLLK